MALGGAPRPPPNVRRGRRRSRASSRAPAASSCATSRRGRDEEIDTGESAEDRRHLRGGRRACSSPAPPRADTHRDADLRGARRPGPAGADAGRRLQDAVEDRRRRTHAALPRSAAGSVPRRRRPAGGRGGAAPAAISPAADPTPPGWRRGGGGGGGGGFDARNLLRHRRPSAASRRSSTASRRRCRATAARSHGSRARDRRRGGGEQRCCSRRPTTLAAPIEMHKGIGAARRARASRGRRRVAFQMMPNDDWEIYVVGRDGKDETRVTREIQHDLLPQFLGADRLLGDDRRAAAPPVVSSTTCAHPATRARACSTTTPSAPSRPNTPGCRRPTARSCCIVAERDGDTVSPPRGVYLDGPRRESHGRRAQGARRREPKAERALRENGRRLFAPIAADVKKVVGRRPPRRASIGTRRRSSTSTRSTSRGRATSSRPSISSTRTRRSATRRNTSGSRRAARSAARPRTSSRR